MREMRLSNATIAEQQTKMEKMQADSVDDMKAMYDYLGQVHAMIAEVIKTSDETVETEAGLQTGRPDGTTAWRACARKGDVRVDVCRSDMFSVGGIVVLGNKEARAILAKGTDFRFPNVIEEFLQDKGFECLWSRWSWRSSASISCRSCGDSSTRKRRGIRGHPRSDV